MGGFRVYDSVLLSYRGIRCWWLGIATAFLSAVAAAAAAAAAGLRGVFVMVGVLLICKWWLLFVVGVACGNDVPSWPPQADSGLGEMVSARSRNERPSCDDFFIARVGVATGQRAPPRGLIHPAVIVGVERRGFEGVAAADGTAFESE
jgi:hypothetical protein